MGIEVNIQWTQSWIHGLSFDITHEGNVAAAYENDFVHPVEHLR